MSTTEVPADLAIPEQDRDQGVRSRGKDDGAGHVHVHDGGLEEVHRPEKPAE